MAKFNITQTTTVAELKSQFSQEIGGVLRIYEGRSEASEAATLVSLGATPKEWECRTSRTVGSFEKAFQDEINLKVKVYTRDNWVKVLDDITLETASKLPNGMTKAKMEAYVSNYATPNRKPKEEKCEIVNISADELTANKKAKNMKKINIDLYGEGTKLDVFDTEDDLMECYNAMRDGEYFEICVVDGKQEIEYHLDDFGCKIFRDDWPEDIYDEEKIIDTDYLQFEGKMPSDVYEFGGCDLYEPEDKGVGRIELVQTKVTASATIELNDDEEFDPMKAHFMYAEFVVPGGELEVNTGIVYKGKQYPFEVGADSDREIIIETIWEEYE